MSAGAEARLRADVFQGVRSLALLGYYGSADCQPIARYPGVAGARVEDALRALP